eukprot:2262157-Amphidinium_carterae.1
MSKRSASSYLVAHMLQRTRIDGATNLHSQHGFNMSLRSHQEIHDRQDHEVFGSVFITGMATGDYTLVLICVLPVWKVSFLSQKRQRTLRIFRGSATTDSFCCHFYCVVLFLSSVVAGGMVRGKWGLWKLVLAELCIRPRDRVLAVNKPEVHFGRSEPSQSASFLGLALVASTFHTEFLAERACLTSCIVFQKVPSAGFEPP